MTAHRTEISAVTVNGTETVEFCYLGGSSSSWCFRPETARVCVLLFFLAYTTSTIFLQFAWWCH